MRSQNGYGHVPTCGDRLPERMQGVLALLLDAYRYATQLDRSLWDFAVEARGLRDVGLTASDFRWLVCKGFVRHAREVTALEDDERRFERIGDLMLARRTCLVLTEAGAEFAAEAWRGGAPSGGSPSRQIPSTGATRPITRPSRRFRDRRHPSRQDGRRADRGDGGGPELGPRPPGIAARWISSSSGSRCPRRTRR